MTEQGGSSVSGAQPGVFMRAFLPGLVLGIVIGAVVVFLVTEVIGQSSKFKPVPSTAVVGSEHDERERSSGEPSQEEIKQMTKEAREAAESGSAEAAPPAEKTPAQDTPESDG